MSDSTTPLGRLPGADKQNLTFSRRELPGKLLAIGATLLLPKRQSEISVNQAHPPEFKIGDLVASDWIGEFGENFVDFGEILGTRFSPEGYSCYPANSWLYYIRWTHTTCGLDYLYPCYDGEPTTADRLRLVSYA